MPGTIVAKWKRGAKRREVALTTVFPDAIVSLIERRRTWPPRLRDRRVGSLLRRTVPLDKEEA